jgi:hypothetical protein
MAASAAAWLGLLAARWATRREDRQISLKGIVDELQERTEKKGLNE